MTQLERMTSTESGVHRQRLDLPIAELHLRQAHALPRGFGARQHGRRHVDADDAPLRAHGARGQETVDARAAAQVQHRLARSQVRALQRIAAAQRQFGYLRRQFRQQRLVIERWRAATVALPRHFSVALAHDVVDRLAHAVSLSSSLAPARARAKSGAKTRINSPQQVVSCAWLSV